MKKIPLEIYGLHYSQSPSGAYALIIGEKDGLRRLPIMIGNAEAQAIALGLENYKTERPLTHDLFHKFALTFGIELIEIIINKFSKGIFYSLLIVKKGNATFEIDSRTSDAIALALKFKCPMYTYNEILEEAGIFLEESGGETSGESKNEELPEVEKEDDFPGELTSENPYITKDILSSYSIEELNEMLQSAIQNEEFENASLIRDEIKHRKK